MNSLTAMVKRNIKLYYRKKSNVFFSMLAVLILIGLHFIVFRSVFTDNWVAILADVPGFAIDRADLAWLTDTLMFAAVLPIGAVTIALTTLGQMVADRETGVFSDFMTSPLPRNRLLVSYLISSLIVSATMLLGFLLFFEIYYVLMYGIGFTIGQAAHIILVIFGSLVFANVFMLLLISFFKSMQSLSAVGTIVGTLIGFLSGAYVMVGMFGDVVRNIFGLLPFLQLTVLSRQAFLSRLEDVTPLTNDLITGELARDFGIELWIGDTLIKAPMIALMVCATTIALLGILIFTFSRVNDSD